MRFIANGPAIPDELLLARDQGRVVFFCGAGVSRARANLPDFFGLAAQVISTLRVSQESPAYKLIQEAQEIDKRVGVPGVISADRVFGLLEREFLSRDIEAAVAAALKPATNCNLSPHKILLDLATTTEGIVRLSDGFRSRILWHAEQWSEASDENGGKDWRELLPEFIRDVWPRQIAARSSTTSARLFDIAFSNEAIFREISELILPLLGKVDGDRLFLPELRKPGSDIVDLYPEQVLALLCAVLPDDAARWPYGIEKLLKQLEEANADLGKDERLISLKRRCNAR